MDIDCMIRDGKPYKDILIEIRNEAGMTRKELAEYLQIPYRTMTDWERGQRQMPSYVLRMMIYQLKAEGIIKQEKGQTLSMNESYDEG